MALSKKKKTKKLTIILTVEVVIIVLLLIGGKIYDTFSKIQKDNSKDDQIIKNEEVKTDKGYKNVVIFGVDSRQNDLKEGTNSDTIIIASINNNTKDVKLASIYRDTYVNIPGVGYDKINAAYCNGGYSLALSTINTNFDLNLKEYVTVNFQAVVNVVDQLGGITLDITEEELPYVNGYVHSLNRINGTHVPDLKHAGTLLVNGTQATAYSRIRYTAGGDYKRTERQRTVITKIFQKVKSSDFNTINSLIDEILPQVYTNLSTVELLSLAKDVLSYSIVDQTGFPFEPDAHRYQSISYVFPIDLSANVTKLHEFLFGKTDYVPSQKVKEYSAKIETIREE
jgi:LCP family protein required for cell wall assembly